MVRGRLEQNDYTDKNGIDHTSYQLQVNDIGPSLVAGTAKFTKAERANGNGAPPATDDPLNSYSTSPPGSPDQSDEPPF